VVSAKTLSDISFAGGDAELCGELQRVQRCSEECWQACDHHERAVTLGRCSYAHAGTPATSFCVTFVVLTWSGLCTAPGLHVCDILVLQSLLLHYCSTELQSAFGCCLMLHCPDLLFCALSTSLHCVVFSPLQGRGQKCCVNISKCRPGLAKCLFEQHLLCNTAKQPHLMLFTSALWSSVSVPTDN